MLNCVFECGGGGSGGGGGSSGGGGVHSGCGVCVRACAWVRACNVCGREGGCSVRGVLLLVCVQYTRRHAISLGTHPPLPPLCPCPFPEQSCHPVHGLRVRVLLQSFDVLAPSVDRLLDMETCEPCCWHRAAVAHQSSWVFVVGQRSLFSCCTSLSWLVCAAEMQRRQHLLSTPCAHARARARALSLSLSLSLSPSKHTHTHTHTHTPRGPLRRVVSMRLEARGRLTRALLAPLGRQREQHGRVAQRRQFRWAL